MLHTVETFSNSVRIFYSNLRIICFGVTRLGRIKIKWMYGAFFVLVVEYYLAMGIVWKNLVFDVALQVANREVWIFKGHTWEVHILLIFPLFLRMV